MVAPPPTISVFYACSYVCCRSLKRGSSWTVPSVKEKICCFGKSANPFFSPLLSPSPTPEDASFAFCWAGSRFSCRQAAHLFSSFGLYLYVCAWFLYSWVVNRSHVFFGVRFWHCSANNYRPLPFPLIPNPSFPPSPPPPRFIVLENFQQSCAEACSRLCTFGKVYKNKAGMPFNSLVKAFLEEFSLPPDGFPASEDAALIGKHFPPLPSPLLPLACAGPTPIQPQVR